ncbi:Fatty acid metabolism regulator protein [Enhygromyxa salina]|uniref:Fatty acid metabolism regulator protein n=1 Tax=Enhygromyxa salina TaxID=215803 RepID=A0A2S9XDB4_9BACT|nr:TetR/AcrR family transcriptional regulator [Enhygromyxa salina]PRP90843.1 Fatty acid metabolism regulator protein [Enhygromyxa salina]
MPKPTFLNLPQEKRRRITELALDEFSTHPYRQASLSRIVSRAGIAKGSMYQYFENKLDLYRWLVTEELGRRRAQWLESDSQQQQHRARQETGLFAELEQLVLTRIGFMLAHPRLARLAASAMEPSTDAELRELHGALRREHIDKLVERIRKARSCGDVRDDLDPRTLAHLIDALVVRGTTHAVLDRLGVDVQQFLTEPSTSSQIDDAHWRELVREALSLIRDGIAPAEASSNIASQQPEPLPVAPRALHTGGITLS